MLPVLIHFKFDTGFAQAVAYFLGLIVIAYSGFSGWRGMALEKPGASSQEKLTRGAGYALVGAVLARVALYYMLPASAFLGHKGEGLPLHTYGLLLASGFLLAVRVSALVAEKEWRNEGELRRNQVLDLAFWVLMGALIGSHVLYMLVNWRETATLLSQIPSHPDRLADVLLSGLVFQGGLLGATLVSYFYARSRGMDFLRLADVAIPTVSLGSAVGRLGCFSAGCCWGDVVPQGRLGWLAVHFPGPQRALDLFGRFVNTSSLAYQSQIDDKRWVVEATGQLYRDAAATSAVRVADWVSQHGHTLPLYPTQIFDSVGNLTLFVVMLWARRFRRFHGQILGMWLMAYAVLRSSVELFRGDAERGTLHGLLESLGGATLGAKVPPDAWYNLSTGQFISLCMFALGATLLIQKGRAVAHRSAAHPAAPVSA